MQYNDTGVHNTCHSSTWQQNAENLLKVAKTLYPTYIASERRTSSWDDEDESDTLFVNHTDRIRKFNELYSICSSLCKDQDNLFLQIFNSQEKQPIFKHPVMQADGAYYVPYCHITFALFLNQILKCIHNPNIDFHVLCQGQGYGSDERWYETRTPSDIEEMNKTCTRISEYISKSNAFQTINKGTAPQRIIVWLKIFKHALAIGWDVQNAEDDTKKIKIYLIDNRYRSSQDIPERNFEYVLLLSFSSMLQTVYGCPCEIQAKPITSIKDIPVAEDFKCATFVARATLYISQIRDPFGGGGDEDNLNSISKVIDIHWQKAINLIFENMLLEFCTEKIKNQKKILTLPRLVLSSKFININDVVLEASSNNSDQPTSEIYVFNGFSNGFTQIESNPSDRDAKSCTACRLMSQFPTILDSIRACRALIHQHTIALHRKASFYT